jgi:hypothetical protein
VDVDADTVLALLSAVASGAVAFREHRARRALAATVVEREAIAVQTATEALNRTVQTVQAMAQEAIDRAARAEARAERAETAELRCTRRLDALSEELDDLRTSIMSGRMPMRREEITPP